MKKEEPNYLVMMVDEMLAGKSQTEAAAIAEKKYSEAINEKPWEVWLDYATEKEERMGRFRTMREAMGWLRMDGKYHAHFDRLDVLKRLPDGTLTTEF